MLRLQLLGDGKKIMVGFVVFCFNFTLNKPILSPSWALWGKKGICTPLPKCWPRAELLSLPWSIYCENVFVRTLSRVIQWNYIAFIVSSLLSFKWLELCWLGLHRALIAQDIDAWFNYNIIKYASLVELSVLLIWVWNDTNVLLDPICLE